MGWRPCPAWWHPARRRSSAPALAPVRATLARQLPHRPRLITKSLRSPATFRVDGFVTGTWKVERRKAAAALLVEPFEPLTKKTRAALAGEGEGLLRFVEPEARAFEVRFA